MFFNEFLCHQCLDRGDNRFHCYFAWEYQHLSPFDLVWVEKYINMTYVILFMTYVMTGSNYKPVSAKNKPFSHLS
jgi:hypothetical protein